MYCLCCLLTISSLCAMQTACLQLINAIVSTPDELDFRLHLRNEFLRFGLADALQVAVIIYLPFVSHCIGAVPNEDKMGGCGRKNMWCNTGGDDVVHWQTI